MDLKDIAAVSGKGGLFRVIRPTRNGVILESLDDKKSKLIAGMQHQVSVLDEISIYTMDTEGSRPLIEVLRTIKDEFDDDPGVDSKSSPEELHSFMKHILPDHDPDRVYTSDIKKLVTWYHIIYKNYPEVLEPDNNVETNDEESGPDKTT